MRAENRPRRVCRAACAEVGTHWLLERGGRDRCCKRVAGGATRRGVRGGAEPDLGRVQLLPQAPSALPGLRRCVCFRRASTTPRTFMLQLREMREEQNQIWAEFKAANWRYKEAQDAWRARKAW